MSAASCGWRLFRSKNATGRLVNPLEVDVESRDDGLHIMRREAGDDRLMIPATRGDRARSRDRVAPLGHHVCVEVAYEVGQSKVITGAIDCRMKRAIADEEPHRIILSSALR